MGILEYNGSAVFSGSPESQTPFASGIDRAVDNQGTPAPFARRYVYQAGTQSLAALFADTGLTVSTANPMVADQTGVFGPCGLIEGLYDVEIRNEKGAILSSVENVPVKGTLDGGEARGFRQLSHLLANDTLSYTTSRWRDRAVEGAILDIAETGQRFAIAGEDSLDFDHRTAGGVKLIALNRRSPRGAEAAATNPDGTIVEMDGLKYMVDASAVGAYSATSDLGVDGLRPFGQVRPAHYGEELQRAIANSATGEIYLPDGTIEVDHLHLTQNASILGQGRMRSKLLVTGSTTYDGVTAGIVASGNNDSQLASQMRINGVEIDCSACPPGTTGLLVMRKLNMDEVHIHQAPSHGILLRSGAPNEQAVYFADFSNVWSKRNGGSGLRITDNSNANKFELCHFDSNSEHGVHQVLINLPGVNQAIYNNIFVGGQASYNQKNGIYIQNGANTQIFGMYSEYNSQIDGGDPRVGAFNNVELGPTVSRCNISLGEQGTDNNIEGTIGLNTVTSNIVSVGGLMLTPMGQLNLGYANTGTGRTIKMLGGAGAEHRLEFHEGNAGAIARMRYNGVPGTPKNQILLEVTSDQGNTWQTLWHGTNNGKFSVFGKPPVDQGVLEADATDLTSAIALVNNLKSIIKDFGIAN